MKTKLTYKISPRLFTEDKAFGPGVAALLHRVDDLHSLRAAAMSMGMAYSKAWTIVKNSENAFGFKFLTSTAGGKGGGGAVLTAECNAIHDACGVWMRSWPMTPEKVLKALGKL